MKTFTAFAASAVVAMISLESAVALPKYLDALPNGALFKDLPKGGKELGHTADGNTEFGTMFSKNGGKWDAEFCKKTYPGTTMTMGQAFGDPCCKWTGSGAAEKTINAWADKPTSPTTCDSAAAPSTAPASAAPSTAPASATPSVAPSTAPAGKPSTAPASSVPAGKPSTAPASSMPAGKPSTAPTSSMPAGKPSMAPAPTPASSTPSGGKKPNLRPSKCKVKEEKSYEEEEEGEEDY